MSYQSRHFKKYFSVNNVGLRNNVGFWLHLLTELF